MTKLPWLLFSVSIAILACNEEKPATINLDEVKNEIVQIERAFRDDLKAKGVAYAFFTYAAPDAVIKRENDTLIKGSEAIKTYYSKSEYLNATADCEADFTDVSADGTLAYTYGKYSWTGKDPDGKEFNYSGVFHTVWKKQPDGTWKYVWD